MTRVTLIVDDSLTIRADLEDAFAQAGLPTVACASVAEARNALSTQEFGLIILDVVLPDGDGVDLLKEIRATAAGAAIPVLMLSSEADVQDRIRGLVTGSNDYVGKPYDQEYIITRARELLQRGASVQTQAPREKISVLLIDDSVTFRETLGELLRGQGFEVLSAVSGEEGLRSAALYRPDAIVVDEVLPGIDGSTVVRKLRLDAALRHTTCILLTGSQDHGAELRGLESGADAFVRKEEDLDVILARIIAVLRKISSAGAEAQTASLHGAKKILAVDDSITYLQELGDTLSGEGYDVILARSGEEALDMVAVQVVDCILLDRLMPGLGGMETCRRIKASPAWRDIPLIMLTAMEDREAMIEGLSTGADDYVLKSNELDVLKARLRAQLRRKQFEDESRRVRIELMNKELEIAEARAARELFESRATLLLALEQKNSDLEIANAELLARQEEIADKNRQLEKASRLKSEFLSTMSHELRTPLNAILGLAYLLEQSPLDRDANDMVSKIQASGRSLLGIINDVLDVSKIEAGHMVIEKLPFRLDEVIDKLADSMSVAASGKQIKLIVQAPPAGVSDVIGDALRLEQVLMNLSSNAIKFTERGQVEVSITLLSRQEEKIQLRFSVKDSGIGIADEVQAEVFSPFIQADSSTTRRFGGTGLGLTICRQLVNLMGGEIGLSSALGVGSEFWFTLPLSQIIPPKNSLPAWSQHKDVRSDAKCDKAQKPEGRELTGIRILVVDDSDINREVARRILVELGAIVTLAEDGQAALDWLLAHPTEVDLVLMDVQMPVMDGIEATRHLRSLPQFDDLAIVALTAGVFKSQQDTARAAGMTDFISKPFDVPSTVALIQRLRRQATVAVTEIDKTGHQTLDEQRDELPIAADSVIDIAQGLQIWSDLPSYLCYLHRFCESYANAVALMNLSLAAGDRQAAAALAHKLSSDAGNMALGNCHSLAREAEQILNTDGDPNQRLMQLGEALEQAISAIHQFAASSVEDAGGK